MSYAVNPFGRHSVVNYHHMILSDHGSNVRIVFQLNLNFPLHFLANKHLYCYRAMFQRFIDLLQFVQTGKLTAVKQCSYFSLIEVGHQNGHQDGCQDDHQDGLQCNLYTVNPV